MAIIPLEEINNVRMHANIVEVIGSYIPLMHRGKNYFCVCPFHEDHSPSMSVSSEKQIYKCFSCGAAGNVITFIQNYENVSFIEAVQILAKRYGITLSNTISPSVNDKNARYYEMMDYAEKFFQNNLKTDLGKQARDYLKERGLDKQAISEFGIGLTLSDRKMLYRLLKGKKFTEKEMDDVALVNTHSDPYDYFVNRIMFPLHNPNGNIVGFSGRIFYESEAAKYVNTRETVIFKKGQILFNYHRAKPFIRNEKRVILVEGYMDAIRLYINGVKNVLAIMGTSLTKEQIALLRKLNAKIILCLDNDEAGQKAIYDIGQSLKKDNFEIEVIKLSGAKDPDEYVIKNGIEAFKKNLKETIKYLDFSLNYLKQNKNLHETVDLAKYINDVLADIASEKDEILIDITLKKLATDYNLEYDMLKDKLKQLETNENVKTEVSVAKQINVKERPKNNKYIIACKKMLFYMMNEAKYVRIYQNNLVFLDNLNYREIAKAIIYYYETNKDINLADFLTFASTNERFYPIVLDIINECNDEEIDEDVFMDYLNSIQKGNKQKTIKELKESLKDELDKSKKIEIAMKIAELKKGSV